ncbi:MAG: hypothetical protein ACP5U1_13820 [Desulfomonilaceae bacterium]
MTTRSYPLITGAMFLAIMFTNFGVFVTPSISHETLEQERTECLNRCDTPGLGEGFGGDRFWQLQNMCVQKCERRYWQKWQQEMNSTGKK